MKKRKYIWMILLFVTVAAFAGRRVTIRLDGRPAMELIEAIEGQTGLRVLGDPAVLDSLTVTVDVRDDGTGASLAGCFTFRLVVCDEVFE